jgi:hypothetical protein
MDLWPSHEFDELLIFLKAKLNILLIIWVIFKSIKLTEWY